MQSWNATFFLFFCYSLWGGGGVGDFGSGSGSKFNCAARVGSGRVGSDDLGYGPGSGFSFEPVQNSSRDQLEHLASPMTKSESKYQRVQDKSETIEKRLESGLPYN